VVTFPVGGAAPGTRFFRHKPMRKRHGPVPRVILLRWHGKRQPAAYAATGYSKQRSLGGLAGQLGAQAETAYGANNNKWELTSRRTRRGKLGRSGAPIR
jgi:hypothetical protein